MIQQNKIINTSSLSNFKVGADLLLCLKPSRSTRVGCASVEVYLELIGAEKPTSDMCTVILPLHHVLSKFFFIAFFKKV